MKTYLNRIVAALLLCALGASCTTAYDAYGNPRQVVEPGTAALGAVAAGLAGYAIANNRNNSNRHHRHGYGYNNYRYSGYNRSYARSPYRYSNYNRGRTFQGYRQIRY